MIYGAFSGHVLHTLASQLHQDSAMEAEVDMERCPSTLDVTNSDIRTQLSTCDLLGKELRFARCEPGGALIFMERWLTNVP